MSDSSPAVPEAAITDEAIEVAAGAIQAVHRQDRWDSLKKKGPSGATAEATAALSAALPHIREQIAAQVHGIGATAMGVYTDDYQDGLRHATLAILNGDTKHPSRYTSEERAQMFAVLNAITRGETR